MTREFGGDIKGNSFSAFANSLARESRPACNIWARTLSSSSLPFPSSVTTLQPSGVDDNRTFAGDFLEAKIDMADSNQDERQAS